MIPAGTRETYRHRPAWRSTPRVGDLLIGLAGKPVTTVPDLHRRLGAAAIGKRQSIEAIRAGAGKVLRILPRAAP